MTAVSLESRIRRLEDRAEIVELIARYVIAVDNRDIAEISDLYTSDGIFEGNASASGVAAGNAAIVEFFRERWKETGWSTHSAHVQILDFLDENQAVGCVTGHAEHAWRGHFIVAAHRYHDYYLRDGGRWRFRLRRNKVLYLMPLSDLPELFRDDERKRWPGQDPQAAELPETADAFRNFRDEVRKRYQLVK
jgi:hypothetical protein